MDLTSASPDLVRANMTSRQRPFIINVEGNHSAGVTSVIKELLNRHPQKYSLHPVFEPLRNIVHSVIGDIRWNHHQTFGEGIAACTMEMMARLDPTFKKNYALRLYLCFENFVN